MTKSRKESEAQQEIFMEEDSDDEPEQSNAVNKGSNKQEEKIVETKQATQQVRDNNLIHSH